MINKYKYLSILFISFLFSINTYSQCTFINLYNNADYYNDGGFSVIQTLDGGSISVGNSFTYFPNVLFGSYIVKTNNCGELRWKKFYDFNIQGGDGATSVIQLKDSSFIICGWQYDTIEHAANTYLLKLNTSCDIIWHRPINVGFNDVAIMHKLTQDNGFVITGTFTDTLAEHSFVHIIKTDSAGNIKWKKIFVSDTGWYQVRSLDYTYDKGYIISGCYYNFAFPNWDMFIIKTDSMGNFEWKKTYGNSNDERKGFAISTLDKGFAIVGYRNIGDSIYQRIIYKTDSLGNVQWQKIHAGPTRNGVFNCVHQLPDSSYVVTGSIDDIRYTPSLSRVYLAKLNKYGDTIWTKIYTYYGNSRIYGPKVHDYVENFNLTSNGGFILCGYIINDSLPAKNDLLLIKTDSLGNTCEIDTTTFTGCSVITSLVKIPDYSKFETQIYPNPANNVLNINIDPESKADVFIYDIQGSQLLHKNIFQNNTSLNIQGFPQGVYFVKVVSEAGTSVRKLVKE